MFTYFLTNQLKNIYFTVTSVPTSPQSKISLSVPNEKQLLFWNVDITAKQV